jgi:hypothetical protein
MNDLCRRVVRFIMMFIIVYFAIDYITVTCDEEMTNKICCALFIIAGFMFIDTYYPRIDHE